MGIYGTSDQLTWTRPSWQRLGTAAGSDGLYWRLEHMPHCPEHHCLPTRTWWFTWKIANNHLIVTTFNTEWQHRQCWLVKLKICLEKNSPLCNSKESLGSECSFCVDVHGLSFTATLINGQLWNRRDHVNGNLLKQRINRNFKLTLPDRWLQVCGTTGSSRSETLQTSLWWSPSQFPLQRSNNRILGH